MDGTNFNIYYYGGFDGIHPDEDFYDDVWVLSLPSFTWTKISEGTKSHARAGHKCFLPYPDQMMVVGGYTSLAGTELTCLEDGPIVLFNITSGQWLKKYDPDVFSEYAVPEQVHAAIGGGSKKATATAPAPSGWATPALGDVFATTYNASKIKTYWPYTKQQSGNKTEPPVEPPLTEPKTKGVPGWVAPVLGVVLSMVLLSGSILLFCIWRRRIHHRRNSTGSSSATAMSERLFYWIKAPRSSKSPLTIVSSYGESESGRASGQKSTHSADVIAVPEPCHEMENTQIAELGGKCHGCSIASTLLTY